MSIIREPFTPFFGVIEDVNDPEELGRVRVRCYSFQTENKSLIPTDELHWFHTIVSNSASISGIGNSPTEYVTGSTVFGYFIDSALQEGIVIGSYTGKTNHYSYTNIGFNDPNGKYPSYINESDVNRLARGDKSHWMFSNKSQMRFTNIDGKWSEPSYDNESVYPLNNVYETQSGHVKEYDNTPDHERIHEYHRTGTYTEVRPDGSRVIKIMKDKYSIVAGDDFAFVNGTVNLTIASDVNHHIEGNYNIQIDGDKNEVILGNNNTQVLGNSNNLTFGNHNIQSHSKANITSDDITSIDADNVYLNSGYSIELDEMDIKQSTGKIEKDIVLPPTPYSHGNANITAEGGRFDDAQQQSQQKTNNSNNNVTTNTNDKTSQFLTLSQFKQIFPNVSNMEEWFDAFVNAFNYFNFQQRISELPLFFAQVYHESLGLTVLKENMYYTSAQRIHDVWPLRFPSLSDAEPYVKNPVKLANKVYSNRMGNGDESSGDGYRYIGRGPIQITGKNNYTELCSYQQCVPIASDTELLTQPTYGALGAVWFYSRYVPSGSSITQSTKAIDGGYVGISDRVSQYQRISRILNNENS